MKFLYREKDCTYLHQHVIGGYLSDGIIGDFIFFFKFSLHFANIYNEVILFYWPEKKHHFIKLSKTFYLKSRAYLLLFKNIYLNIVSS